MKLTVIWRLIVIQYVFYRHGLDDDRKHIE